MIAAKLKRFNSVSLIAMAPGADLGPWGQNLVDNLQGWIMVDKEIKTTKTEYEIKLKEMKEQYDSELEKLDENMKTENERLGEFLDSQNTT